MTRNRFNQAKHKSTSTSTNNLTLSKARGLFLEDTDDIDMKDTYKITNVHPPRDEKDVVNKEYCDNNLLSSSNKIDILSRNITELRKGDFDKVTTKTLQLNETQFNEELINEFIESTNEVRNTVKFCNKVAADTISKYNQFKQEFDNNKFNQNITNIHLDEMFTNGLREMKSNDQSKAMTNPTAPSERLLYTDLSSVSERLINEKIQANNKFNNNINITKDTRNYYETETNNYNKKLKRYKNYINIAEITEIVLSSIATTATSTSVALTGMGLVYSIPTAFAKATVCGSLSKTINNNIRNKIIKYSQMYILSKQFSDKFNKLYTKSMNDNKIDNDEYNEFVKLYEDYKKNKKNKLSIFLD